MADTGLHLLYGGTFDPIHLGHLAVARAALAATGAPSLAFLPAADPPHRAAPGASFAERLALIEVALAGEAGPASGRWAIDDREGRRDGRSYTVDTLREWRREHGPDRPLAFVLGADAFLGLPTWHAWTALFDLAHLVVARRPGSPALPLDDGGTLARATAHRWVGDARELRDHVAGRLMRVDLPARPESATAIRGALAAGRPAQGLPPAVAARIAARGLYAER
ncbi:MAG: nicotinate-nucleotide adenylyltransferase [Lysobacteraceae bacterium]|jgi:nicotinate-nucleotide adenylyltransferase|nr:nicotinate-nucleotide adenylyltransferase [Silanimonas sp.]